MKFLRARAPKRERCRRVSDRRAALLGKIAQVRVEGRNATGVMANRTCSGNWERGWGEPSRLDVRRAGRFVRKATVGGRYAYRCGTRDWPIDAANVRFRELRVLSGQRAIAGGTLWGSLALHT
jgi:hypothetical protein